MYINPLRIRSCAAMQNDEYVFINLFKKVIKEFLTMSVSTAVIKRPQKS